MRIWKDVARHLEKMLTIVHLNIVPSIAAISRGEKRYFVSQWADGGSLQDLWKSIPHPDLNADLVRESLQQLQGLASALEETQLSSDSESRLPPHGSLKPESILRFENGPNIMVGTLKIAVLGLEQRLTIASYRGLLAPPPPTAIHGAISYELPEALNHVLAVGEMSRHLGLSRVLGLSSNYRISSLNGISIPHYISSLYDVWSMGCIILELLVWLLYGYDELRKFQEKMRGLVGEARLFFAIKLENGNQVVKVCSIVSDYMDYISKDPECAGSTGLGDLFRFTQNSLLVVSVALLSRSTLTELRQTLESFMRLGEADEWYFFTGTKRDSLRGPSSVSLFRDSSFLPPNQFSNTGHPPTLRVICLLWKSQTTFLHIRFQRG
jgi:serine/threonine protein kinase